MRKMDPLTEYRLIRHTACFTGHRPEKLGGYDMHDPTNIRARNEIYRLIVWLYENKEVYRFISGGALGWDQLSFWAVEKARRTYPQIENIVAVPFKDQPNVWKSRSAKKLYSNMIDMASEVIYVDEELHFGVKNTKVGKYHIKKMNKRNTYMVHNSEYVIAGYDGSSGGTHNCINEARMRNRIIYRINPANNFSLEVWDKVGGNQ